MGKVFALALGNGRHAARRDGSGGWVVRIAVVALIAGVAGIDAAGGGGDDGVGRGGAGEGYALAGGFRVVDTGHGGCLVESSAVWVVGYRRGVSPLINSFFKGRHTIGALMLLADAVVSRWTSLEPGNMT